MNEPETGAPRDEPEEAFGAAVCLKLAADGEWETALTQPLQPPPRGLRTCDVDRWLAAAGDDVAAEIGFATGAFVGLRFRPPKRTHVRELLSILLAELSALSARHSPSRVRHVLALLDRAAQTRFAGQLPTHAEVGVLDRWRSLGAVNLGPPPWGDIPDNLNRQPGGRTFLTTALPAPLMLEVAYGPHGDGWLAAPVSRPDPRRPERHYTDPDSLDWVACLLSDIG